MRRMVLINRILSKLLTTLLVVFMMLWSVPCSAANVLQGSLKVPSQVAKERLFTVKLQAQCSSELSVVMFTLEYNGDIEYRKSTVSDNGVGTIQCVNENNTVRVVYLNTVGINVSEATPLADVTFKAGEALTDANFKVYTAYSTSSNEVALEEGNGMEYTVEIVEKVSSTSNATGNQLEKTTEESDEKVINNKSDNVSKDSENSDVNTSENESTVDHSVILPTEKSSGNSITVNPQNSNVMIFIAGGAFALTVVVVVAVSYRLGKNSDKSNSRDNSTNRSNDK